MPELFTIGHSNHPIDAFVGLVRGHGVETIADVRSQPHSRRHPQYRRDALRSSLTDAGIGYLFLGRELGARSEDPRCYVDARVDYTRLARTPAFQAGLDRLAEHAVQRRVALMCAEKDPLTCHRTILVCRALVLRAAGAANRDRGPATPSGDFAPVPAAGSDGGLARWTIWHILADGRLESANDAETRLLDEVGLAPDLLRGRDEAVAEAYLRRGKQIAFVRP